MFDTSSLGIGSLLLQLGGGLMAANGAYNAAKAQKSTLKAQAGFDDINARISELGAQSALQAGQQQVGALTLRAGALKSSQRTSMAANGVALGPGSTAEVLASTDIMKEIDSNTITANAVRSAWGYRQQATNYTNAAIIKRAGASSISPDSAALSSLVGSAGTVAGSWYQMTKAGVFGGNDVAKANASSDPIQSLGESRSWW